MNLWHGISIHWIMNISWYPSVFNRHLYIYCLDTLYWDLHLVIYVKYLWNWNLILISFYFVCWALSRISWGNSLGVFLFFGLTLRCWLIIFKQYERFHFFYWIVSQISLRVIFFYLEIVSSGFFTLPVI